MSWPAGLHPGQCWRPRAQMGVAAKCLSASLPGVGEGSWVQGPPGWRLEISSGLLLGGGGAPQFLVPSEASCRALAQALPWVARRRTKDDHLCWPWQSCA